MNLGVNGSERMFFSFLFSFLNFIYVCMNTRVACWHLPLCSSSLWSRPFNSWETEEKRQNVRYLRRWQWHKPTLPLSERHRSHSSRRSGGVVTDGDLLTRHPAGQRSLPRWMMGNTLTFLPAAAPIAGEPTQKPLLRLWLAQTGWSIICSWTKQSGWRFMSGRSLWRWVQVSLKLVFCHSCVCNCEMAIYYEVNNNWFKKINKIRNKMEKNVSKM